MQRETTMPFTRVFLLLLLLLAVPVAGCFDNAPSLADARRGVCQTLDSLRESFHTLHEIDPNSSVAQVRELRATVDQWITSTRGINAVLQIAQISDLLTAYNLFSQAVDGLNSDARVGDAAARLQAAAAAVDAAFEQAYQAAQCNQ